MSQLTRRTIMDCTVALAEKQPLSKITVKNIVDACGITRNTFYYYFHDIYDVIDGVIDEKLEALVSMEAEGLEDPMFEFLDFCVMYKKVWKNLYKSVGHDQFERFVMSKIRGAVQTAIKNDPAGSSLSDEDLELVSIFYEEALFGSLIRWLNDGKDKRTPTELKLKIDRIRRLFDGQLKLIAENSRKEIT